MAESNPSNLSAGEIAGIVHGSLPPWLCWVARFATLATGCYGGFRSLLLGLTVTSALSLVVTRLSYSVIDCVTPRPALAELRSAIVADILQRCSSHPSITAAEDAASDGTQQIVFSDKATGKSVLGLSLTVPTGGQSLYAIVTATLGGGPSVRTPRLTFYDESQTVLDRWLNTNTVTLPASVHAFERASLSHHEKLKQLQAARDAGYTKSSGDATHEVMTASVKTVLDGLGVRTSVRRQVSGYIQASTLMLFYALSIQLVARFWLNYVVERQVRKRLGWLWDEAPIKGEGNTAIARAANRSVLANTAQEDEVVKRSAWPQLMGGAHCRSAYLDLYVSAARAFVVEGDYKAVPSFLDSCRNAQAERMAASQNLIRFLLWSLPTVGFIGTVVGIGQALLTTIDVESLDKALSAIAKSSVSSSIGVSFDTTLVALLLAFVGMLAYHLFSQLEDTELGRAHAEVMRPFVVASSAAAFPAVVANLSAELRVLQRFREDWARMQRQLEAQVGKHRYPSKVIAILLSACILLLILERLFSQGYLTGWLTNHPPQNVERRSVP